MFQLYYDTRAEALAQTLARLLADSAGDDPLLPRTVLVPQLGLERWLTRTLAERHGIAANIEFVAPAQFAWRLLRAWRPDLAMRSPFDREVLVWRLFALLPQVAQQDARLADLLAGRQPSLRRLQLARQLAHLFERYQAYRPKVLDAWRRGDDAADSQARLWRALTGSVDEAPRSRLMADFIRRFGADGAAPPPELPAQVFAYGCINISPLVLDLLRVVARHAELHFLMPTPCGEYWGDLPHRRRLVETLDEFADGFLDHGPPNRLLVSLGGVGREFVARVFTDDEVQTRDADGAVGEPARDTLLHRVQADIITLAQPDPGKRRDPDPADRSIQIQICHSPLREVQVLHDHLLDMLAADDTLEPRDIVVMVPQVDRYAAAVEAVFGAIEPHDPRHLPWTVADRAAANAHPLTALFADLLNLPAERLSLDRLLQMLEVPAVQRAMQLEGESLEDLRAMAVDAGIRWGEDGSEREREGLPAFDDFSFAFGRRRLLLGYLLGDEQDDSLLDGIAPMADIEGERAHAFGALIRLERQLHALQQAMRLPRSPLKWQALFNAHLGRMLVLADDDQDAARALADVRQALAGLVEDSAAAGFDEAIDWTCVRELLGARLEESRPGQRFLDGGVSVCSMVPMRDVPFRVVCVLGLDAESFPRRDEADALSLIRSDAENDRRRLGDRSVREDDRYLFLQTLMAARQRLYLSYPGVDLGSGKTREPSVLLSEFVDHVCAGYFADTKKAREALVTTQPMHPFAPRLFGTGNEGDGQVFTYRGEWRDAAASGMGSAPVPTFIDTDWPDTETGERIDLAVLKRFFAAPQKSFLRQRPGLAIADIEAEIGREPLVLDPLHQALMQRRLLQKLLAGETAEGTLGDLRARAMLPPLAVGAQAHAEARAEVLPQTVSWRDWAAGEDPRGTPQAFELEIGDAGVLHGTVTGVIEHGFAGWVGRAGSVRRWFDWWLDALAYRAAIDAEGECRAFGINKDNVKPELPLTALMLDRDSARAELRKLVGLMREGLRTPLLLPPRSGWVLAEKLVRGKGQAGIHDVPWAFQGAAKKWQDGDWPENRNAWIATVLRGREPFADPEDETGRACHQLAEILYVPVWRALLQKDSNGDS